MSDWIHHQPLLLVGLVALAGFYFGGLAKRARLPSIIGYMALGVLIGPSLAGLFDHHILGSYDFITEIALGFVAFGIGSELSLRALRRLGRGIVSIIFAESLTAFFVVTLAVYAVTRSWPVAVLFGGVAPASAPAGTVAVIQEYRAKGTLTKALYAVVGFDDGLAIIIFGFAAALAKVLLVSELAVDGMSGGFLAALQEPIIEVTASIGIGTVAGFLFSALVRRMDASRDMLILTFAFVLITTALAEAVHGSLILSNMIIGFVLVNTRREAFVHRVTEPLQGIMPLLFILFFTLAGAHLELSQLPALGLVGIVYIAARTAGLIGGAVLGSAVGAVDPVIRKYIGLGILSQAGVAIGLSLIVRDKLAELGSMPAVAAAVDAYRAAHPTVSAFTYDPVHIGTSIITTITATCIVFEIIGPVCTKIALEKAGEIPDPGAKG